MSDTDFFDFKDPYVGQVVGGEFHIEEQIGMGGMGAVYRATQAVADRPVAVKLLHRHLLSETVLRRFRQEAQIISRLSHPNIVTVFKYGQHDDGALYIAMELATGRELTSLIQAKAMMDPRRALPLMIQMADAVGYAHDMKIVHRDIKPENMIVGRLGREERVKVLDFGIAKIIDTKYVVTKTGMLCGSPPYMAPEQWKQVRDLDGRTDIYALGCVYYAMLTSRIPFQADSTPGYMNQHLAGGPLPPVERNHALEAVPGLSDLVLRAMARDRADRFPDAFALRDALESLLLDLRTHSQPPSDAATPDSREPPPPEADATPRQPPSAAPAAPPGTLAFGDVVLPEHPASEERPASGERPVPNLATFRTAPTVSDSLPPEAVTPRHTQAGSAIRTVPRTAVTDQTDPTSRRIHRFLVTAGLLLLAFLACSFAYFTVIAPGRPPSVAPVPNASRNPARAAPGRPPAVRRAPPRHRASRRSPGTRGRQR